MLRREEILKQFTWGISILDAYLYFNTVNNYTDIHIISENFICDLLNILYGHHLANANKDNKNQSGYDLIDRRDKRLFQISTTNRPAKVLESIDKALKEIDERKSRVKALEEYKSKHKFLTSEDRYHIESSKREIEKIPDNENGRICFLFLKRKAEMSEVMNYKGRDGKGYPTSDILYFDYKTDILCFDDLINRVNYLSEEENSTLRRLQSFMKNNSNLFIKREDISPSLDAVSSVIDEYADNFIAPMFLHIYKSNKYVMTLKNLYVDPKLSPILDRCGTQISEDSSVVEVLDDFLWNKDEVRMLFIDGDAAIGKTSLISWICYHYKVLDDIGKAVFCGRKIICIRLRELDFDECKTSEDCILSYLKCDSIDYIETHYSDSIIILEGADELSMVQGVRASSIEQFLLDIRKIFRYHKIIITSRPKFINMQTILEAGETIYHFFMQHFDSTMRLAWIEKYQCYEAVSKSTVTYIKEITDLEADGVADTPLALYLLAASNLSTALSSNRWNLYHEIFNNAIITTRYNENLKYASAHPAFSEGKTDVLYDIVGEVSLKLFQDSSKEKYFVTSKELDEIIQAHDYSPKEQEILKKSCVLCAYWKKNTKEGALEFYHNDIRDFFFGEYIYSMFSTICNETFDVDKYNKYIELCARFLQFGPVSKTTWEQTYSFIYWRLKQIHKDIIEDKQISSSNMRNHFSELVEYMLSKGAIWSFPYSGVYYTNIKNAFINGCLLLKVLIDSALHDEYLHLWHNSKEKDLWFSTNILTDWKELLTSRIIISKTAGISFVSKIDLDDFDFSFEDLRSSYFFRSKFDGASFEGTDLTEASFQGAHINNTSFEESNVSHASFQEAYISNTCFKNANLSHANFSGAVLQNVDFSEAELEEAVFEGTEFTNVKFPKSIDTNIMNCKIMNSDLSGKGLHGKKILDTHIEHTSLKNANLTECLLFNVTMKKVSLDNVKLDKAQLKCCKLIECQGKKASLVDTLIEGSNIEKCKLQDSDLLYSTFENTNINNLDLSGSSLRALTMSETRTSGVKCERCDFLHAKIGPEILSNWDLLKAYNIKR